MMRNTFYGGWWTIAALVLFVIIAGIVLPRMAYERCLAKGGERTIGRDMLCIDSEGRFVKK